ncbi:non-ribosomal peptide synthetase [Pantoea ananatis]|uniref:non-ribosomal peptide synthetase n=1 Tax=Pantoea ananas TaxID=553 RepID=UPI001B303BB1|nr:non-ribosomal peptide synthetase [Pantoea ananatis]
MNKAQDLLKALRNDGVNIWLEGSELRYRAPHGVMSPERLEALRSEKQEIVNFLLKVQQSNSQLSSSMTDEEKPTNIPLSSMQERLWALNSIEGLGPAYHITGGVTLKGTFDKTIFELALKNIVLRHDALRTRFSMNNGTPEQIISPDAYACLEWRDLSSINPVLQSNEKDKLIKEFIQRPFDLEAGGLCRVLLLQTSREEHISIFVMHHMISDGWSLNLFVSELSTLYLSFSKGECSPFESAKFQYSDYVAWQKETMSQGLLEKQVLYWKTKLEGVSGTFELPLDKPRSTQKKQEGANYNFKLPEILSRDLKKFAHEENATVFIVLAAAFNHILSLRTGRKDIILGTSVAGRTNNWTKEIIGFFANTIILRTHVSSSVSFRQLVQRTKETVIDAFANQELPYDKMLRESIPTRDNTKHPLSQILFTLHNYPKKINNLPNLEFELIGSEILSTHASKRDISLHMVEHQNSITGVVQYSKNVLDESTIANIIEQYIKLLRICIAKPMTLLSNINFELTKKWHEKLKKWNNTLDSYPNMTFQQLFNCQAKNMPEKIAVKYGDEKITYGELDIKAGQFANTLISLGQKNNPLIALYCDRSIEMIIGLIAIMKTGGAYVPLSPSQPKERIYTIIEDSKIESVVTLTKYEGVFTSDEFKCRNRNFKIVSLDKSHNYIKIKESKEVEVSQQDLAYVIYTSGSTGQPKGVAISNASICNFSNVIARDIYKGRKCLNLTVNAPVFFDMSLKHISQLAYGHSLFILDEELRLSPGRLLKFFRSNKINGFECTPSQLSMILDYTNIDPAKINLLPDYVLLGGEKIEQSMWDSLKKIKSTVFYNMYGPTEATVDCMYSVVKKQLKPTIGSPIANYRVYLLDSDLEPVQSGVPGEIYIGGVGLAEGYLNNPALTAEKFIPDPFSNILGERMYKSGDLARFNSAGEVEYLCRVDDQVKLRGFRVELEEIENALCDYPGVKKCIVLFSEKQHLVAYLLMQESEKKPTNEILNNWLAKKIPDYMIPSYYSFIESIPLNANGKVDKKSLPSFDFFESKEFFITPTTKEEIILSKLWCKILNIESVSINADFFELGGHSMLAVRLLNNIYDELGIDLPVRTIFENRTISAFSKFLEDKFESHGNFKIETCIQKGKDKTPLFFIHASQGDIGYVYNFKEVVSENVPIYGISALGFVEGEPINTSIEDMATSYIGVIRNIQPKGPYQIVGWSAGGTIAWEIARQLLLEGQSIHFLGLIDTLPLYDQKYTWSKIDDQTSYILNSVRGVRNEILFKKLLELKQQKDVNGMLVLLQDEGFLPPGLGLSLLNRHLQVRLGIAQALSKYIPSALPITANIFCATENNNEDISHGWENIQSVFSLDVSKFFANHSSIVENPMIHSVWEKIERKLLN